MRATTARTPSRRTLAVATGVAVLIGVPLALIASAPSDDSATVASSDPASVASAAGASERRASAAPADLPPLLFVSDRDGGYRLYAAEPDGRGVVAVVEGQAAYPAWSHDGTRIAYVGDAAGFTARRAALAVVEADGAVRDVVAGPQVPSRPTFRDRDGELWFQSSLQGSNGAAGVSERATIDAVSLRDGRPRTMLDRRGAIYQPAWSPDGRRLAVVLGDPDCREGRRCRQTLAVSDPGGLTLRTLVADGAPATPAWSPDGGRIAFTSNRDGTPQIWVVDVADGSTRQVTSGGQPAAEPAWSPDGGSLAFSRDCEILVQRIGAATATNVTRTRACELSPAWRPEASR